MVKETRRGIHERSLSDKPRANWKKYLIAPLLLGAMALADTPRSFGSDPYRRHLAERGITDRDIRKGLTFDSCQLFIVGEGSDAVSRVMRGYGDFLGATLDPIPGSDGRLRSTMLVSELAIKEKADSAIIDLRSGITPEARKAMASAAATGNPDIAILALTQILPAALQKGSHIEETYNQIQGKAGSKAANEFLLRAVVMLTFFDYASTKTSDFGNDFFVNAVVHEAVHCAIEDFRTKKGLPEAHHYDSESMAYSGEAAYGRNPWVSLVHLEQLARFKYLNDATTKYGIAYAPPQSDLPRDFLGAYVFMFYDIYGGIAKKTGIHNPIDLIGKSGARVREAAKASLDEQSRSTFGTDFDNIIAPEEIARIKDAAFNYATKEYGR